MAENRRIMKNELISGRLSNDNPQHESQGFKRKISNFDGNTCWLNSTLQLILCGMDFFPYYQMHSSLGKELQSAQTLSLIDPTFTKFLLQSAVEDSSGQIQDIMTGQQCTRDALIILYEHRNLWPDVFRLLHHTTSQTTTCLSCGHSSFWDKEKLYTEHFCPLQDGNLNTYLEFHSNQGETIEDLTCYRCKATGLNKQQLQIKTEESSLFFLVLLSRVETNYSSKINATDDLTLLDSNGHPRIYSPLGIIHHRGGISDRNYSSRHYMCDIRSKKDMKWYYTSDSSPAKQLRLEEVTKAGVVILYMRKS